MSRSPIRSRWLLGLASFVSLSSVVWSQTAPSRRAGDISPDHWAAPAVRQLRDRGVLDPNEAFVGDRLVNRYELSGTVERFLDRKPAPSAKTPEGLTQLRDEVKEGLPTVREKVLRVEVDAAETMAAVKGLKARRRRGELDRAKAGRSLRRTTRSGRPQLTGFIAAGLVRTDDGAPRILGPGAASPTRTRYISPLDSAFFTLPQVSVAWGGSVDERTDVHLRFDHATDRASRVAGVGNGVGVNEVFVRRRTAGGQSFKLGGFALPFQSAELDAPFRTASKTITPGPITTFLESFRVLGVEGRFEPRDDLHAAAAAFTGMDLPTAFGAAFTFPGTMTASSGLQGLSRSRTRDDDFGFYLDLGWRTDASDGLRARVGWLDGGGDLRHPTTPSLGLRGLFAEVRDGDEKTEWLAQHLRLSSDTGGGAGRTESELYTFLVSHEVAKRTRISARWDEWQNRTQAAGTIEGDALTVALTRTLNDRSRLQVEWLHPDEGGGTPAAPVIDTDDELFQVRWSLWF